MEWGVAVAVLASLILFLFASYKVGPTAVDGDCASPSSADYKIFEYAPSDFTSSVAQALGPDGRCLRRVNIASGTSQMQNFANWFSYTRKRHGALKAGAIQALQDLDRGRPLAAASRAAEPLPSNTPSGSSRRAGSPRSRAASGKRWTWRQAMRIG